jgi:hypothetical protein
MSDGWMRYRHNGLEDEGTGTTAWKMRVRALFSAALLAAVRARGYRKSCCLLKDACEAHVLKQALTALMSCAVLAIDSEYANRVHFRREGDRRGVTLWGGAPQHTRY